jgi:hypothetical protein
LRLIRYFKVLAVGQILCKMEILLKKLVTGGLYEKLRAIVSTAIVCAGSDTHA